MQKRIFVYFYFFMFLDLIHKHWAWIQEFNLFILNWKEAPFRVDLNPKNSHLIIDVNWALTCFDVNIFPVRVPNLWMNLSNIFDKHFKLKMYKIISSMVKFWSHFRGTFNQICDNYFKYRRIFKSKKELIVIKIKP